MRRIELFESFKDNWPPCGPFSSMEEVDKVCDELRDMFVDFVDAGHHVKVRIFTKGIKEEQYGSIKTDGRYSISIALSVMDPDVASWGLDAYKSYNTDEVYDSVMMACDYMKEYYDFDIEFSYHMKRRRTDIGVRTKSSDDFPRDIDVIALYIVFKEKL